MAYMDQKRKAELAPNIKRVLARFGLKGSLSVRNHSTLVLTIKSGMLDFISSYCEALRAQNTLHDVEGRIASVQKNRHIDVNPYHYDKQFTGQSKMAIGHLLACMNVGNHDNSDIQSDYFDVGWYVDINIGKWDQPYEVIRK